MTCYFIELGTRKYVKRYRFLSFVRNLSHKYGKELSDKVTKQGLDALKVASKKVVQKAAEVTGEFIENKITDKLSNQNLYLLRIQ